MKKLILLGLFLCANFVRGADFQGGGNGTDPLSLHKANNLSDVTTPLTSLQNLTAKGADIASASTTDLSTATGPYLNVTGTATINSFGTVASGARFYIKFTGAGTITYNATSMILPGGANVPRANGDTAAFESLGGGNWQCLQYYKADGTSLVGSSVSNTAFSSAWNAVPTIAPSKSTIFNAVGASWNYPLSVYGAGTAYSLTASDALVHMGTTDPTLVLSKAGTYRLDGRAYLQYNGATYAANQTATLHLQRTNNTPAAIANATTTPKLRVITTLTDSVGIMTMPPAFYTTSSENDSISVYGSVSATPSAGSVDVTEASIIATLLYPFPAPTITSAIISSDGVTFTLAFNEPVSIGAGGNGGFALSLSSGSSTPSYTSGAGSSSLIYTLGTVVNTGVTGSVAYTQPGAGVNATTGGTDVASFSGFAFTNNSSQGSWTQRASDDFTAHASGNLTQNANWTAIAGTINYNGSHKIVSAASGRNFYSYTGASFNAAQYSQITVSFGAGSPYSPGCCVRAQATTTCYYLEYDYNSGSPILQLVKDNAGTLTVINSTAKTPVDGNRLRLEAVGTGSATRLTAYEDTGGGFVAVWSNVDPGGTYIDGGKPGVFFNNNNSVFLIYLWSGGDQ